MTKEGGRSRGKEEERVRAERRSDFGDLSNRAPKREFPFFKKRRLIFFPPLKKKRKKKKEKKKKGKKGKRKYIYI